MADLIIKLEDTGFFDLGSRSSVYNRLKANGINHLDELLERNLETFDWGKNHFNDNYFVHDEIEGVISLLKFKYLGIQTSALETHLNFILNPGILEGKVTKNRVGSPGYVFYHLIYRQKGEPEYYNGLAIFQALKGCGFDFVMTKALLDHIYSHNIKNITLKEYFMNLNEFEIIPAFFQNPKEGNVFLHVLLTIRNIILLDMKKENKKSEKAL